MAPDDRLTLTMVTVAFFSVAGLTWFFSSRPRMFIRVFVPANELRGAVRGILREPHFCRRMRVMAAIQTILAAVIGVAAAWCWFSS